LGLEVIEWDHDFVDLPNIGLVTLKPLSSRATCENLISIVLDGDGSTYEPKRGISEVACRLILYHMHACKGDDLDRAWYESADCLERNMLSQISLMQSPIC
jgi:hypothetical protein